MATELTCVLVAVARERRFLLPRLRARRRVRGGPCKAWRGGLECGDASTLCLFLASAWRGVKRVEGRSQKQAKRGCTDALQNVLLVQTGMGADATFRALEWAWQQHPARVIATGFCGALTPLPVGAIVRPGELIDEHGVIRLHDGGRQRLVSVSAPVFGEGERRALHERTGAVAVDMESAAAARWCQGRVPFACLRVVSDGPDAELPAELSEILWEDRIRPARLMRALLRRPSLGGDLWRLAAQTRVAASILADSVEQLLASSPAPQPASGSAGG